MTTHPTLIGGAWLDPRPDAATVSPRNPATGEFLPDNYPVSTWAEIEAALHASHEAKTELRSQAPEIIAPFLEAYAAEIETRAGALVEMAHLETALPVEPRLRSVELPRTTGQLRQAAAAARDRSWRRATIDTKINIRSILGPLDGPVVVFGPNNFPYAFNGVSGGDFAAAIAAGNPVIAKANPGHPGTTRLLAEAALAAIGASGAPASLVQMLYHLQPEDGLRLVAIHWSGQRLLPAAAAPVWRSKRRPTAPASPSIWKCPASIPSSFCLAPWTSACLPSPATCLARAHWAWASFAPNPAWRCWWPAQGEAFVQDVAGLWQQAPGVLLSERGPGECAAARGRTAGARRRGSGGWDARWMATAIASPTPCWRFPAIASCSAPALQTEVFGPVALLVLARSQEQMLAIARSLEGNLTASVYTHTRVRMTTCTTGSNRSCARR